MVFYVVVPIIFGFFANFFIPYHVGSKDVAFPRLNSMGFWLQPMGFILLSRPAFLRPDFFKSYDIKNLHLKINKSNKSEIDLFDSLKNIQNYTFKNKQQISLFDNNSQDFLQNRNILNLKNFSWYSISNLEPKKDVKTLMFVKCSPANQVMSGWTFITPFSSRL